MSCTADSVWEILTCCVDHLFLQDITELPGAAGTHLRLCCPTCCFSGPVARTASPPSWLNIYEQSNEDKNTITAKGNQQTGCAGRRQRLKCYGTERMSKKVSAHVWETRRKTSHRLISVPAGSSGRDAHDPCWRWYLISTRLTQMGL